MTEAGVKVARILTGSWRAQPPRVDFDASMLASVEQQLMASGAAGLTWWRIRKDPVLSTTAVGRRFHDAFRLHTLHAKTHEEQIVRVLSAMRANGVEPLLIKGWDAARMYPERGMRPYGDIDLWVTGEELAAAARVAGESSDGFAVDLEHEREEAGSSVTSMFAAAHTVPLGEISLTVLCEEDRLRVLALHYLKGGGWRPSSLCDVAAALESRSTDFAWDRCLTRDTKVAGWVCSVLALCGRLLGADLPSTPAEASAPPRWLQRSILNAWSSPWPESHNSNDLTVLPSLAHPFAVARGLRRRWPDPVSASLAMNARLGRAPRFPLQTAYAAERLVHHLRTRRGR